MRTREGEEVRIVRTDRGGVRQKVAHPPDKVAPYWWYHIDVVRERVRDMLRYGGTSEEVTERVTIVPYTAQQKHACFLGVGIFVQ